MPTINNCNSSTTQTSGTRRYLSFTRSSGKFIYCNYPEKLTSVAVLGDYDKGNKFLNQVEVNGAAQLFASHYNQTGYNIYFGVQLYNAGSSTVTVTLENNGHRNTSQTGGDFCSVDGGVWDEFYRTPGGTTYAISPGGVAWIHEKYVPAGAFFNSVVRFRTSNKVWCFPYVYTSRSKLNGTASCYPWNNQDESRGYGDSYYLTSSSIALKTSEMPIVYWTNACGSNNTNEMTTINDYCANKQHSCSNRAGYLGNWGMQYLMNVSVQNNSTTAKTIKAYIGNHSTDSRHSGHSLINYSGNIKWCCGANNTSWNWLTDTIPAGSTYKYQYQYIPIANTITPLIHSWRLA